ncbi:MAG: DUF3793 family protein [Bacillota bacterium]|nr:DUF3793 family protein [Bacillota bacterium]
MKNKFEKTLVYNCSATLKGLKTGSLFLYKPLSIKKFKTKIYILDKLLSIKGIRISIINKNSDIKLIYVYRPKMIASMLAKPDYHCFLCQMGYPINKNYKDNILHLIYKLEKSKDFPHEIGLFLGYPIEDVLGFIKHKGKNYTLCGAWKVYGKPKDAQKRFDLFENCRKQCMHGLEHGYTILQLATK